MPNRQPDKMLSFAPAPIFSGTWDHRPAVPSPLSSSPARASSPLSPIDRNVNSQRQTQSSPIQQPKFKFASRPTRPNPVVKRREEVQEQRRKNFLQSVRQKSEDKRWQQRDVEGQLFRASYLNDLGQLWHDAPEVSEGDIQDAMTFQKEQPEDDVMTEVPEVPEEEDDIEAMIASYEEQAQRPPSPTMSDEDYDDIFAELAAQEQPNPHQAPHQAHQSHQPLDQTEAMDEDSAMSF